MRFTGFWPLGLSVWLAWSIRFVRAVPSTPEAVSWNCTQTLLAQTTLIRNVAPNLRRISLAPIEYEVSDCSTEVQALVFDVLVQDFVNSNEFTLLSFTLNETKGWCQADMPPGSTWGPMYLGVAFPNNQAIFRQQFAVSSVSETGSVVFSEPCPYDGPEGLNRTDLDACRSETVCSYETGRTPGPEVLNATHGIRSLDVSDFFCIHPETAVIERPLFTQPPTQGPTMFPIAPPPTMIQSGAVKAILGWEVGLLCSLLLLVLC